MECTELPTKFFPTFVIVLHLTLECVLLASYGADPRRTPYAGDESYNSNRFESCNKHNLFISHVPNK